MLELLEPAKILGPIIGVIGVGTLIAIAIVYFYLGSRHI